MRCMKILNTIMRKRLVTFSIIFAATFVVLGSLESKAAAPPPPVGPPPPPGGGGPTCWPPPCIPIDGGIGLLFAAGLALGGKKLYSQSKK